MFSVAQAVPCCFLVTSLLAALAALSCALCTCLISEFELTKTRIRMINELHERIAEAEAHSDQELIWSLEEQLDWWISAI